MTRELADLLLLANGLRLRLDDMRVEMRAIQNRLDEIEKGVLEASESYAVRTQNKRRTKLRLAARTERRQPPGCRQPVEPLTARESEALRLLAHGYSYRQMASQMGIHVGSINKHICAIYGKLGVNSVTQAALYAWRAGLVDPGEAWEVVVSMQWGSSNTNGARP